MRITALAGGVGGARFLRGLRAHLDRTPDLADSTVTVIGNTGDDITLFGLRVCPDLDTVMYTLGGGINEEQGWGRVDETHAVQQELAAYGAVPQWFGLGDRDFGTHVVRSQWLGQGVPLSEVTARLAARWGLPDQRVTLLPMSDTPVETHVVVDEGDGAGPQAVHFQEWWVRMRAAVPAQRFVAVGMDRAAPAPGVLDAIREADVILLPPSNPVVSIGIILGVPGVRDALRGSRAPGRRGVAADRRARPCAGTRTPACPRSGSTRPPGRWPGCTPTSWTAGWSTSPTRSWPTRRGGSGWWPGRCWMHDVPSTADIAGAALDLAAEPARRRRMTPSAVPAAAPVTLTPLLGMPEVHPGDDLAALVVRALAANGIRLADGDVLVVSSKIASKALGLTAAAQDRSEAVLRQSRRVVAERDTPLGVTRVVEAVAGPVMAAAGVDASNTGAADVVLLLPADPDEVARALRARIARLLPGAAGRRHPQRHGGPALAGRADRLRARRGRRAAWSTTCAAARTATAAS